MIDVERQKYLTPNSADSPTSSRPCSRGPPTTQDPAPCGATTASRHTKRRAYVQAVLDRGRAVADAQAPAEQNPSGDRTLAAAETDVAEANPGDRRLQDDHLAADGAAGLEPQALDLDDRARAAARPDAVGNPRGAQTGTLCQDVAAERRYGSALDRHTPRPTLPCSCSTTARNGCSQAWLSLVTRMDSTPVGRPAAPPPAGAGCPRASGSTHRPPGTFAG